jgi:hypothetical protein
MSKGKLCFSSVYALNVWDVQILNKSKRNIHSCGSYTVTIINNISKKSMRSDLKALALPVLKSSVEACFATHKLILENQLIIDTLYSDVCMDKDSLFSLAKKNNSNWPIQKNITYDISPLSLSFANTFELFERQCLDVDILVLTGWIDKNKSHSLHKSLCKPLRSFMQTLSANAKTLQ